MFAPLYGVPYKLEKCAKSLLTRALEGWGPQMDPGAASQSA
jgi:hypothetical protein